MSPAVSKGIIPYFTDETNWNPAGHRLAAQAIAEYLANWQKSLAPGAESEPAASVRKDGF